MPPNDTSDSNLNHVSHSNSSTAGVQYRTPWTMAVMAPKGTLVLAKDVITFTDTSGTVRANIDVGTITYVKESLLSLNIHVKKKNYRFLFPGWKAEAVPGLVG